MKCLRIALWISALVAIFVSTSAGGLQTRTSTVGAELRLRLTTSIIKQNYQIDDPQSFRLKWTLRLSYINVGEQTIILPKGNPLIYRATVSRSIQAANEKRYEEDAYLCHLNDFRDLPDTIESSFVF